MAQEVAISHQLSAISKAHGPASRRRGTALGDVAFRAGVPLIFSWLLGEGASRLRSDPFGSARFVRSVSPFTEASPAERGAGHIEESRPDPCLWNHCD